MNRFYQAIIAALIVLIILCVLWSRPAVAEAHEQPEQLPSGTEEAMCIGGGAAIAAIASGVAAGPALVAIIICVIIAEDLRYHADGGTHED